MTALRGCDFQDGEIVQALKVGMKRTQALDNQILVLTEALDAMFTELQQFKKAKGKK
ncbi:unnamed protein product, partial [Ostreobium quekettii]